MYTLLLVVLTIIITTAPMPRTENYAALAIVFVVAHVILCHILCILKELSLLLPLRTKA